MHVASRLFLSVWLRGMFRETRLGATLHKVPQSLSLSISSLSPTLPIHSNPTNPPPPQTQTHQNKRPTEDR